MTPKRLTPMSEVFAPFEKDPEYRRQRRFTKPYFDLMLEIVKRRLELGINQKELAEKAGTYQSRISKIESAEHDIRLSTLIQIAEALQAEVSIHLIPVAGPIFETDADYQDFFTQPLSQKTHSENYVSIHQ